MLTIIADCETDGLLPTMTRLWTIQIGSVDGEDVTVYADQPNHPPLLEGVERLKAADRIVMHNGLGFDLEAINRIYPNTIRRHQVFDTLVAARLHSPEERSHALRDWGLRLGVAKGDYTGDFQQFDDELATYCIQDIHTTRALYHHLSELHSWGESLALEHEVAWAIIQQERNGFRFNTAAGQELDATLRGEMAQLETELRQSFPPIAHVSVARATNRKLGIVKGQPRTKWETFEPGSRHHIARRLQALGWRPQAFGKDSIPTVDEKILAEMPWPEAQLLLRYLRTQKLLGQLSDGKNSWLKAVKPDGRVHGRVNPNGAATGRMTHFSPNVAQADGDPRMRSLWLPRDGWNLVGVDASSLEACMLAHYVARWDGGAYAKIVVEGDEAAGTDNHSRNAAVLNKMGLMVNRKGSKTLLYAYLYGAGDWKLAAGVVDNLRSLGKPVPKIPRKEMGLLVRRGLARAVTGLDKLTEAVKKAAKERGYLIGLDGRHLLVRSDHAALNTLLQGAGAVVMKKALVIFMDYHGQMHGSDWALCANVHDEVQMEADPNLAEAKGQQFADCIRRAGEYYSLRCPLSGAFKVGDNWAETH